ncbi:hypothetical protein HBA55_03975 [Pseudomaricurvus alkylphenolicus]|uniref:hypothetical protein n=1 Tax=Pseudomaricurvus alkylphenolicus TaxID=1306991 RepID=UPI001420EF32|nr:hypothetical protein [Pseudomaricurvus alkylphenolicus]NIB38728.1 hypothetical protein [Pseudomaricurvus alkylphenolicus]
MKTRSLLREMLLRTNSAPVIVEIAKRYMEENEWGNALLTLEAALESCDRVDKVQVYRLLSTAYRKINMTYRSEVYKALNLELITEGTTANACQ